MSKPADNANNGKSGKSGKGGKAAQIDIERLADKVYQLMQSDARLESRRGGKRNTYNLSSNIRK